MKFKMGVSEYILHFFHSQDSDEDIKEAIGRGERVHIKAKTMCVLYLYRPSNGTKKFIDSAVSYCSVSDRFSKSVGRKKSIAKLFKNRSIKWMSDKESKKVFWKQYFEQTNEKDKPYANI